MTTNHVEVVLAKDQARVQVGNVYYTSSGFLPSVDSAAYDSHTEQHNARCHPGTRTELLSQIRDWAYNPDGEIIFWLNGMAGTGKSTISRTVAKTFADSGVLGASFFFKRGEGDRGKAALFFPTISSHQLEKLIQQPLDRIGQATVILVVVDALDECDGDDDVKTIITLLASAKALRSARLRIFITSRPELPIRLGFKNVQGKYQNLALHQIPKSIVERDISAFLRHELASIRNEYNSQALEGLELLPDWPGEHVIWTLIQMAVPLFIFAATVCRFLGDLRWSHPAEQLEKVLQYQTKTHGSALDELDATYLPVLSQLTVGCADPQKSRFLAEFQDVVGPIVLLAEPLSVSSLARLLNISPMALSGRLNSLHSVLSIPPKADSPVRLFHLSFRDFLVDPMRAREFWIDEKKCHKALTDRCIQLMRQHLRRDICGLQMPGKQRSEVDQQTIVAALPPEIQYACRYWVHHLKESKGSMRDGDLVDYFMTRHLLHWLEALGLLGWVSESIGIVNDLLGLLDREGSDKVSAFLLDTKRVIRSYCSIIDIWPLQVYYSAIIFTPEQSVVRRTFQNQFRAWLALPPKVDLDWDACTTTLEGHSGPVYSVAFSHDSKTLASASHDKTVKLWDAATGACTTTLKGHSASVQSVAFSHDSNTLASASRDETVKLWDAAMGACTATLEGHSDWILSVAFSHDSKTLASASFDKTVKLWDAATGACTATLKGHSGWVQSVAFSHDSKTLASVSHDKTAKLWDATTGACTATLKGHSDWVLSVAFSHDSKTLASASLDKTVKLWDATTGACTATLKIGRIVKNLAFDGYASA